MTNNWQGYTNKMLFHARLLLDAWVDADVVSKPAFRDACLNAMVLAHQSLLAEIMGHYRLTVTRLPSFDEAISALSHKGESSSELVYIEQLMQHESWLSSLLKAHKACMEPNPPGHDDRLMIPVTSLEQMNLEHAESAGKVLESLKELVTYSRNFSLEW